MSVLIFFVVLFVLILVHEWGHFIVAKKTGMRVDEFGIGFPPKLFGIKRGETEYTFNLLPIGGFVKIWGENGEENPFAANERLDNSRSFGSRPKWAQALVLVAGVTMNILFAWMLFSATYMIGVPTGVSEESASESAQMYVAGVLPGSPAENIPLGSIITSIKNGSEELTSPTPSKFTDFIGDVGGAEVVVSYTYKGVDYEDVLVPESNLIEDNPDKYIIGTSLSMVDTVKKPFFAAIKDGFVATYSGLAGIVVGLFTLISESFVGQADFSQVAGPVGIVGMVGDAASYGITALLTFTAIISLNLAVINLLPFPALDGGRLVFVAIESVTRKQIPPQWAGRINLIGFGILMLLMIAVTYNDILRLL